MYCSACGQAVDPNQPYCPRCGRQVTPIATATPPPWVWTRVHRHLQTMGILWLVYAGWSVLGLLIALPFLSGIFHGWMGPWNHMHEGFTFPFGSMPWLVPVITVIVVGRAILCVVTGIALLRREPWGRVLAIVTAILTLIKPITGTILAIYTLWVLVPGMSGQEYDHMVAGG